MAIDTARCYPADQRLPAAVSPRRHRRWVKWSTPHFAQTRKPSISSALAPMLALSAPELLVSRAGPTVAPHTVIADMPRIPRRAIARGTRQL
jgi:hypothetical protein